MPWHPSSPGTDPGSCMEACAALVCAQFLPCHWLSAHPIPFPFSGPWPPNLPAFPSVPLHVLTPTSSRQRCPVVARGRAVIARCKQLFPLHIFFCLFECQMWKTKQDDHSACTLSLLLAGKSQQKWKIREKNLENTELLKRQQGKLSPTPLWFCWSWQTCTKRQILRCSTGLSAGNW